MRHQKFLDGKASTGAARALKAELYVHEPTYQLKSFLERIVVEPACGRWENANVFLSADAGGPCAVLVVSTLGFCACYVKPPYRRKGIGSRLVGFAERTLKGVDLYAWPGKPGSREFWRSRDVEVVF